MDQGYVKETLRELVRKNRKKAYSQYELVSYGEQIHDALEQSQSENLHSITSSGNRRLDPKKVLQALGYSVQYRDSVVPDVQKGTDGVAGLLDAESRKVVVSRKLRPSVEKFTLMHEVAHLFLHPPRRMHRDLPVDGSRLRNGIEREADVLASILLMPEVEVRDGFTKRFGRGRLVASQDVFWLLGNHTPSATPMNVNAFSSQLSQAGRFGDRSFISLHEEFGVSAEAMSIRVRELKLI